MEHRTQLLICHELIAAEVTVHESKQKRRRQWCNLAAHAWCYDCEFYVCETHLNTRHIEHRTALAGEEPQERRKSQRRQT